MHLSIFVLTCLRFFSRERTMTNPSNLPTAAGGAAPSPRCYWHACRYVATEREEQCQRWVPARSLICKGLMNGDVPNAEFASHTTMMVNLLSIGCWSAEFSCNLLLVLHELCFQRELQSFCWRQPDGGGWQMHCLHGAEKKSVFSRWQEGCLALAK